MNKEGYPEKRELALIKSWDYKDIFGLFSYIESRWTYTDMFIKKWSKDKFLHRPTLFLTLCTGGWSGNEDLIDALLKNKMIANCVYSAWERGGKHCFEITPSKFGFKTVK